VLLVLGLMASDVVLIMGGETFLEATSSLRLLCVAGLFSVAGNFFANAVLLPFGGERRLLFSTVIGAVVNFALNLVAIPLAGATGAAITTAIAEACVFLSAAWCSRQSIDLKELCGRLTPALVTLALGIGAMLLVSIPLANLPVPWITGFFVRGLCLTTAYAIVLLLKKDPLLLLALEAVRARIGHDDKD
jgi:O-antigen/teichoic acid export membrane protein